MLACRWKILFFIRVHRKKFAVRKMIDVSLTATARPNITPFLPPLASPEALSSSLSLSVLEQFMSQTRVAKTARKAQLVMRELFLHVKIAQRFVRSFLQCNHARYVTCPFTPNLMAMGHQC